MVQLSLTPGTSWIPLPVQTGNQAQKLETKSCSTRFFTDLGN